MRPQPIHIRRSLLSNTTAEMGEFSKIILGQARAIRDAILSLKGARAEVIIGEAAIKTDDLENQTDSLLNESVGALFESQDDLRIPRDHD